jgi:peroxiredoxin
MKKNWLILIIPVLMIACDTSTVKEESFTLQGEITDYESGWVHMLKREQGQFITLDSIMVDNGVFVFEGKIDQPRFTYLKLEGQQNYVTFFLEPGEIALKVSADNPGEPEISGSQSHAVYLAYLDDSKHYDKKMSDLYVEFHEAENEENEERMAEIRTQYEELEKEKKEYIVRYINENTASPVAAYIALRNLSQLGIDELETITAGIDPTIGQSSYVVDLNQRVDRLRNVQIGKTAPDFTMNDTTDNPVALSSLRGKYLLVDFWAAWCPPCRAENPNIVAAYQKYHDKGFDVLGVSLDRKREDWIKAIHDDQLTWHHVSDLKFWSNEAAALYAVNSIPSSVLLDPDGVIIARNLKGEDLHNKLEEIFASEMAEE